MENEVKNGRYVDGSENIRWCKDGKGGKLHREDGPAYEGINGTKEWWLNGKYHREDGPAIEWADGSKFWFLNGIEYTEELYNKIQLNKKLHQTLEEKPSEKKVKI